MIDLSSMRVLTIRETQTLMLGVMEYIDAICRKENIKYFAAYGTLLGAVREHGFISWDDDADLWMMREDYERFCKAVKKYPDPRYFLQNTETDKGFFLPCLARMCINGTCRWPEGIAKKGKFHTGQFVDIFILDYAFPTEKQTIKRQKAANYHHNRIMYTTLKGLRGQYNIETFIFTAFVRAVPLKVWDKIYRKIINNPNPDKARLVNYGGAYGAERENFPAEAFAETVNIDFEDMKLPCPAGYDEVLRIIYGDEYMTPMMKGHAQVRIAKDSPLLK